MLRSNVRVTGGLALAVVLLMISAPISVSQARDLKHRNCSVSPALSTVGVTCGDGRRIAKKALDKSNCPYDPSFQGCEQTVTVGKWICKGFFPGEGWSFTCRADARRINYSGGG